MIFFLRSLCFSLRKKKILWVFEQHSCRIAIFGGAENMDPCQSKCRHPILRWSYHLHAPVTVLFTAVFHVEWKCYHCYATHSPPPLRCRKTWITKKPGPTLQTETVWQTTGLQSWTESSKSSGKKKSIIENFFLYHILHLVWCLILYSFFRSGA